MNRRLLSVGFFGLLALVGVLGAVSASSAASPPTWGKAITAPGTAGLNGGGNARVNSVSCATAGSCTAGGYYRDGANHVQAFVGSQANGSWGNAIQAPATAALNSGGNASVQSVSCATAGNCAAGGYYTDGSGHAQAFVGNQTSGSWGNAVEVPGTAALNAGGAAAVNAVSCATAGNCAAVGYYTDGVGNVQAFVVNETNGTWGSAIQVPGTAILNSGGEAAVTSVSCATAGNCAAGGYYTGALGRVQAFVVGETSGTWGNAAQVPGTASLNSGGNAQVHTISCPTAGNCTAGGSYKDGTALNGHLQALVVDQTSGTWGNAIEVPGTASLNKGGNASVTSVSCPTAGNCGAGGSYTDRFGKAQAFVVEEESGSWNTSAIEVPGTANLNKGGNAAVLSISCPTAGNCGAGGSYNDTNGKTQALVVEETNGSWGNAIQVPATAALNSGGNARVNSVSCAAAGNCTAGGSYTGGSSKHHAFVVSSDTTPPTIHRTVTPSSPNGLNGWYKKGPIMVAWTPSDAQSGIASSTGCGPTTQTNNTGVKGRKLTCTATNGAGLSRTAAVTIKLDATAPIVACVAPPHFLLNGTNKKVRANVSDKLSGAAPTTAEAPATTTTLGRFSVKVTGTDKAGNSGFAMCAYSIGVDIALTSPPPVSQYSRLGGKTIPVAFTLSDDAGAPISNTLATDISTHCDAKVQLVGHGSAQCAQATGQPGKFAINLTHGTLPAGVYNLRVSIFHGGGAALDKRTRSVRLK